VWWLPTLAGMWRRLLPKQGPMLLRLFEKRPPLDRRLGEPQGSPQRRCPAPTIKCPNLIHWSRSPLRSCVVTAGNMSPEVSPFPIPSDVLDWLRRVFAECNDAVTRRIAAMPTTHETSLDMTLIESVSATPTPVVTNSGWSVALQTHYLGGGRHFAYDEMFPRRWEIADIGILVMFRRGGKLLRTKIALLQSKRLYPHEIEWDEDSPLDYLIGFARLQTADDDWASISSTRRFTFTAQSQYKALRMGDNQFIAMAAYEAQQRVQLHYLLYNPPRLGFSREIPSPMGDNLAEDNEFGCRVLPLRSMHPALAVLQVGQAPSVANLPPPSSLPYGRIDGLPGWRLEDFIVDLVVGCKEGYIANSRHDRGLEYIFSRRTGPISAALALTINAPMEFEFD
jgi:hypothetical protein